MTIPTQSNETVAQPTEATSAGELTFTEYEAKRRAGDSIEKAATPSAPVEETQPEQKKSSESDTEETEDEQDESKDEAESDEDEAKSEEGEKPRKKGGFQRRIDKLNAAKAEAKREAEYWKAEALKHKEQPAPKQSEPKADSKAAQDGKPDPNQFETYVEYTEALTDWKIEQREKAKEAESNKAKIQSEHEAQMKAHHGRLSAFKEKVGDFDDVIEALAEMKTSTYLETELLTSELGPEIIYELAKNPAEFERISKLGFAATAKEIGKLEAKLSSHASEEKKPEPKKITKAPKPIEPVGSGKGTVERSIDDPNISFQEYERKRREMMRRKRA